MKCFKNFVQSAVNAITEGDENLICSVVAETIELTANSSYGYQIVNRSLHTVTKYLSDKKGLGAINNKTFKRRGYKNGQLYEVELVKSEIEHKETIIVRFFNLPYAKLRILELYYIFFDKYCDVTVFEELEIDTDSLLTLASNIRAQFVWFYPTSNEKIVELFAKWRLYGWKFSQLNNKFFPSFSFLLR